MSSYRASSLKEFFAGKTAIVTGGTSNIGELIVYQLLAVGCNVVVVGRNREKGQEICATSATASGKAIFVFSDLCIPEQIEVMVSTAYSHFGKIDILINSAGAWISCPLHETELEEWNLVMDVNLRACFLTCKYVLPLMFNGGGVILNIASAGGVVAVANESIYNAAKAAVISLTRSIALEYAGYGIRSNCLCPGPIEPGMKEIIEKNSEAIRDAPLPPIGRRGLPYEIARIAVYLVSDETSYMTGATIIVDGGMTLRCC